MSTESPKATGKRRYEQRRRAEQQAQTRQRIVDAAVELHGTLGPARTTVSAIAERAGVRRATIYRHFPDERSLFLACSGHWASLHPFPDPASWSAVEDPAARAAQALDALYGFFEGAQDMLTVVIRDTSVHPIVAELAVRRVAYLQSVLDSLARGWGVRGRRAAAVRAALALAVNFGTWQTLNARGLRRDEAAALMCGAVRAAASGCADR